MRPVLKVSALLLSIACAEDERSVATTSDASLNDATLDARASERDARTSELDATRDARAAELDAARDARTSDANDAPADAGDPLAALCIASGGQLSSAVCCASTQGFPNQCAIGACGCAPQSSHEIPVCRCPAGSCFLPEEGCTKRACTPGADQTCNDNLAISSLHGRCNPDSTCTCDTAFAKNPATGKCL